VSWFMVRGVVDYCENIGKNDLWHMHSSYAMAAYVRALMAACRPYPVVLPIVQSHENDHIVALLRRVPAGTGLRAVWDAAVPHLPEPPPGVLSGAFSSAERVYRYLSTCNAGPDGLPPVLAFVDELGDIVPDAELATQVHHWVDQQAHSMRVEDALARRRARPPSAPSGEAFQPGLLIEIRPIPIKRADCDIVSWIQDRSGPWQPKQGPGVPKRMALSEVESCVGDLVDLAEQEWQTSEDVSIEFLLPTSLLSLPVEWWRPASPQRQRHPLCVDYQVVVRSLDRLRQSDRPRWWWQRWRSLRSETLRPNVHWGEETATTEALDAWDVDLHTDATMAVVVLSTPPEVWPGREELNMALLAGVPVILWDRQEQRGQDGTQALAMVIDGDPNQLPHRIRLLRSRAAKARAAQAETPGSSIVLLWDDPRRVVTRWRTDW